MIDADAVLLAQEDARVFLRVGGVPVIVKVEAADEVPALLRVRVQVEHRGHPHGQLGLVGVGDEVLQLVAVSLGMAAGRRGQQLFAPLHAPLPECGIILHRYPPPRYRPAGCRST